MSCLFFSPSTDPNATDDEGATPLHFAARYKRMRLAQFEGDEVRQQMKVDVMQTQLLLSHKISTLCFCR